MDTPESESESKIEVVRREQEKACREFTERIASLGFARTKKMWWIRQHEHTADFIHLFRHGSNYPQDNYRISFDVHFGIRVLNDTFPAAALNGPTNGPALTRAGRYHHSFNAKTGHSYERCMQDLRRFIVEQGEPWFLRFRDLKRLLSARDSPLHQSPTSPELLKAAMRGEADPANIALSRKLLGIKAPKG